MKLWAIFRYELAYQMGRLQTRLIFALMTVIAVLFVRNGALADALYAEFYVNAPFVIASVTVFSGLFWLLVAAWGTGEIAARDAETGMHPLTYTAPVPRGTYLGGRFLAAFALNALLQLAVPLGVTLAVYGPGVPAELIGPFRPEAYLTAYFYFALPTAFVGTAVQFAWATLARRTMAAYVGSVLLLLLAYGSLFAVLFFLDPGDAVHDRATVLLDAFGHLYMTSNAVLGWTPMEKSTRLIALEGTLLWSRFFWTGLGFVALAITAARFRLAHPTTGASWRRRAPRDAHAPTPAGRATATAPVAFPQVHPVFGPALRLQQVGAITRASFLALARGRGGLLLLAAIAGLTILVLPQNFESMGTPLLPSTPYLLSFLTTPLSNPMTPWVVVPLLILLWAGELVWREREAGLGEIMEAAPVPEWALLLGKFLGLAGLLAVWMGMLMGVGLVIQLVLGYHRFQIGLYLGVLFGLQLPEYLLFAALALVVHAVVGQKYVGHLIGLLVFAVLAFAGKLGLRHHLLLYGTSPGWAYSDMRGFGTALGPWLWFKLYWAAWALLLAVGARVMWRRGQETGLRPRLHLARDRFTRPTAAVAAAAGALVLALGGFIFYNTNVRNPYLTPYERGERQATYEKRYGRYKGIPQPSAVRLSLRAELYPERYALDVTGTYDLVNRTAVPIDSLHIATAPGHETEILSLSRPSAPVLEDRELGHRIYALQAPLQPGDSLRLGFRVRLAPRGFTNGGVDALVVPNGTWLQNADWQPHIGYLPGRELMKPTDRRTYGLPKRPLIASLEDVQDITGEAGSDGFAGGILVETIMGTAADQVAVAPGTLRRAWQEGGRRYFHYATSTPIGDEFALFSARYAVHRETRGGVPFEVYYHPAHTAALARILHSVRACLDVYPKAYGPYPHGNLRIVENPVRGMGAHADATTIDYGQGFARFDPAEDPNGLDFPFAIIAHEMGHEWGVPIAYAEGAPLLTESFAWYAAMGAVEATYGRAHLERLRRFFRKPSPIPVIRQTVPLLRALDPYAGYRKGPAALYALSEYAGRDRVDLAWRRYYAAHRSDTAPLATTLDLYRELQAVTPDTLQTLLHDLFAANTLWQLKTEQATAKQTPTGAWTVTLRVHARKFTTAPSGQETDVPLDQWIPIGVFAPTGQGEGYGKTLYLQRHRIRSGAQTITVTVPEKPSDAGIDPYVLMIDLERFDNVERVETG